MSFSQNAFVKTQLTIAPYFLMFSFEAFSFVSLVITRHLLVPEELQLHPSSRRLLQLVSVLKTSLLSNIPILLQSILHLSRH